ncbi:unnamed protein product [marine sediment metagenome]|uniref:Uncharacterized protein n=1 Tax=marine sediment metagenome TaxID=412755 RepID=X1JV47_9ZZZZ
MPEEKNKEKKQRTIAEMKEKRTIADKAKIKPNNNFEYELRKL